MIIRDNNIQKSAGGIIYYIDSKEKQPRFLLLKRYALSKKIEWVAPKGKINRGEKPHQTALREIGEETGIETSMLILKQQVGVLNLSLHSEEKGNLEKDIIYFLYEYKGNPDSIKISNVEGYLGIYKWFLLEEVLGLIYYENFRELFRISYKLINS